MILSFYIINYFKPTGYLLDACEMITFVVTTKTHPYSFWRDIMSEVPIFVVIWLDVLVVYKQCLNSAKLLGQQFHLYGIHGVLYTKIPSLVPFIFLILLEIIDSIFIYFIWKANFPILLYWYPNIHTVKRFL